MECFYLFDVYIKRRFSVLSMHSPGESEKIMRNINDSSRSPGLDLKPGLHEYEARMVTIRLRR